MTSCNVGGFLIAMLLTGSITQIYAAQSDQHDLARRVALVVPIVAWLECDHCDTTKLQEVMRLGEDAVPILRHVLLYGPPEHKLKITRERLVQNFLQMKEYLSSRSYRTNVTITLEEYVAQDLNSLIVTYRVRAAIALGEIGGVRARAALHESMWIHSSALVQQAVESALCRIR